MSIFQPLDCNGGKIPGNFPFYRRLSWGIFGNIPNLPWGIMGYMVINGKIPRILQAYSAKGYLTRYAK